MELKNLTTFIYTAELGSFTRAAAKLGYTQSTVSFQIKQLETELGIPLFERLHHAVKLTDDGRRLLEAAHSISQTLDEFASWERETHGQVRLAMADSLCGQLLGAIFPLLRERWPGVTLNVMTAGTDELFRMLRQNEADLVFTLDRHIYQRDFSILREDRVKVHFVAAGDYPLHQRSPFQVEDLIGEPFLLTEAGMSYRKLLDEKLAVRSLILNPVLETGNTDLICDLVAKGAGLSFLPDYAIRQRVENGSLVCLDVEDFAVELWAQLLIRRNKWLSAPLRAVTELLQTAPL